jgi:hypothetical protein
MDHRQGEGGALSPACSRSYVEFIGRAADASMAAPSREQHVWRR